MTTGLQRALGALLLLVPAAALAEHSYSYVEGGFVNIDFGGGDDSGLRAGGAFDLGEPFALIAEYADAGDFSQLTAGLLFYGALDPRLDFNGGVTLEHVELERGGPPPFRAEDDDLGIGLRAGLRWLVTSAAENPGRFELGGELRHIFIFDDSVTSLRGTGAFRIAEDLDLLGAIQVGDDDRFELGVRYHFAPARAPQGSV